MQLHSVLIYCAFRVVTYQFPGKLSFITETKGMILLRPMVEFQSHKTKIITHSIECARLMIENDKFSIIYNMRINRNSTAI